MGENIRNLGDLKDDGAPGATTDIFPTDLSPSLDCIIRITVQVAAQDTVLTVVEDGVAVDGAINDGADLVSGRRYVFEMGGRGGSAINFQVDNATTTISRLLVQEVR